MTWAEYGAKTDSIPWLKAHRDWVEENHWGYGDRPLHYMWYEIITSLPYHSDVLELGVFKGQTLSLWRLIATETAGCAVNTYGITPLDTTGDKYATHPESDYLEDIYTICDHFDVPVPELWKGLSTELDSVRWASRRTYELIYIDGGHDEATVRADIANYAHLLEVGGYLVFDDASCNLPDYGHWYKGLEDVSKVVDEFALRQDFEELPRVGHNRIFRRVS